MKFRKLKKPNDKQIRRIALAGFIICAAALLYPFLSDRWNRYVDSKLIADYSQKVVEETDDTELNEMFAAAEEYNQNLLKTTMQVVTQTEYEKDETYENLLNISGNGIIGYLEIPCIDVNDPIYHYTDDDVLAKGLGHIHGSSLPVGGVNTHSVITGHRGLPAQKFFSDLDKVEIGDKFYIHVLNRVFAYEVDKIETVSPTEVEGLKIEEGKDLVTLATCTPYGVNTDRLLVTGHRVAYDDSDTEVGENVEEHHTYIDPGLAVFYSFMGFIVIITLTTLIRTRKKRKKK